MTILGGLVVFVIAWWIFFFMTLPFGARAVDEPERGHAASAPARPRLGLKALVTTLLAAGFTAGFAYLIESGTIDWRPDPATLQMR